MPTCMGTCILANLNKAAYICILMQPRQLQKKPIASHLGSQADVDLSLYTNTRAHETASLLC